VVNLKKEVLSRVKEYSLINKDENIVIGVSGGPDSMALLYVLLEIKDEIGFNIHIAHINHGVRGEAADNDQLFVERMAKQLGLPYHTKNVDMILYGKEKGISAEEAGRELRYGFFREILQKCGSGKIAVAHNMNDQAETLLMRFLRGTGIDGLKGMEFILGDIIRPILGISREEIEDYIKLNNIETVLDHTNLMPIYTRNKVRLELIPYIEENFNPNIISTLWRTSTISMIDSNFLEKYSKERYNEIVKKQDKDSVILDGKKFLGEDRSIQQRIIRNAILGINDSLQGITEAQITNILNLFLTIDTGKECHISSNIVGRTSYENFIIEKNIIKEERNYLYDINLGGITSIKDLGYSFDISLITRAELENIDKIKNTKYFNFDIIKGSLKIRNRKNGDRIRPYGMKGTKKIKDYFIDEKIPKELRDKIPLLVDAENILWVVGYRTSEEYKVTEDTKEVLVVKYNLEKV
jgi:tRNA(Ile)-lysidine synthase